VRVSVGVKAGFEGETGMCFLEQPTAAMTKKNNKAGIFILFILSPFNKLIPPQKHDN
jgi:hypothetical protein